MTFYGWLKQQTDRRDTVGDLARDVSGDSDFPRGRSDREFKRAQKYLQKMGACDGAKDALGEAYRQFSKLP